MTTSPRPDRRAGFTLTELLMVMMVVAILYCISLSAIRAVDRTARKTAARAELKSIETALKQYYAHYLAWPAPPSGAQTDGGDTFAPLDRRFAEILGGSATAGEETDTANPDKLVFLECARLDKYGTPLNPWGVSGRFPKGQCLYHVAMDTDGDNRVRFPSNETWAAVSLLPDDRRHRGSVIVWTFNPELKTTDDDYLIGSWQ